MSAPSAAWRMTGAHLLSHWLNAIPTGSPKPPLQPRRGLGHFWPPLIRPIPQLPARGVQRGWQGC